MGYYGYCPCYDDYCWLTPELWNPDDVVIVVLAYLLFVVVWSPDTSVLLSCIVMTGNRPGIVIVITGTMTIIDIRIVAYWYSVLLYWLFIELFVAYYYSDVGNDITVFLLFGMVISNSDWLPLLKAIIQWDDVAWWQCSNDYCALFLKPAWKPATHVAEMTFVCEGQLLLTYNLTSRILLFEEG